MRDLHFAVGMFLFVGAVVVVYGVRILLRGRARHARTDADGGSVFLHKSTMEGAYWLLEPLVSGLVALRITPDMITLFSLVPAALAGVAAGLGWFGVAALFATGAVFCDILDGLVARRTGVASDAGEAIDALVDRYGELFLLTGVAVHYRSDAPLLLLALAALGGSFMFSYTTAKAEALRVPAPRGSMRRAERAAYLLVGLAATAVTRDAFAAASPALRELPMLVALALVGMATNVSTVQRFAVVVGALRTRRPAEGETAPTKPTKPTVPSALLPEGTPSGPL